MIWPIIFTKVEENFEFQNILRMEDFIQYPKGMTRLVDVV